MTSAASLRSLAEELEARGWETRYLRELQEELEVLERPPSLISRMRAAAREAAARHWRNLLGELSESKEAMSIIVTRLQGGEISREDRDKVRAQLLDLVKVFPAGLIAAANSAFPIPGTGLFTPWILCRLGLMPSRWREAHLIEQLRKERTRLAQAGLSGSARAIDALVDRLEHEVEARERVGRQASLLTHWDANRNGTWDVEEREAYLRELARLRDLAERFASRKCWFLEADGEIFGALRLSEFAEDPGLADHLHDDEILVCFDGKSGWVALPDLLGRAPRFDGLDRAGTLVGSS